MTQSPRSERLLVALLGVLLFGAGSVFAMVRTPLAGTAGVAIGAGVGGSVAALVVRAKMARQQPHALARIVFLAAFLCSLVMLVALRSSFSLGYLSGFLWASAIGLLVVVRRERKEPP